MLTRFLVALAALMVFAAPAHAVRIKDLGAFQGVRPNQLTGYGIVVGLAGTGDDNLEYATQAMGGVASRFGITLPPGVNPALKNAAAVMVTAELPAFARPAFGFPAVRLSLRLRAVRVLAVVGQVEAGSLEEQTGAAVKLPFSNLAAFGTFDASRRGAHRLIEAIEFVSLRAAKTVSGHWALT